MGDVYEIGSTPERAETMIIGLRGLFYDGSRRKPLPAIVTEIVGKDPFRVSIEVFNGPTRPAPVSSDLTSVAVYNAGTMGPPVSLPHTGFVINADAVIDINGLGFKFASFPKSVADAYEGPAETEIDEVEDEDDGDPEDPEGSKSEE